MEDIRVVFELGDIAKMTTDQKIDLLLKIAFSNHENLNKHGKTLYGNGEQGICDVTRTNSLLIKMLMGVIGTSILGFAGVLLKIVWGK